MRDGGVRTACWLLLDSLRQGGGDEDRESALGAVDAAEALRLDVHEGHQLVGDDGAVAVLVREADAVHRSHEVVQAETIVAVAVGERQCAVLPPLGVEARDGQMVEEGVVGEEDDQLELGAAVVVADHDAVRVRVELVQHIVVPGHWRRLVRLPVQREGAGADDEHGEGDQKGLDIHWIPSMLQV